MRKRLIGRYLPAAIAGLALLAEIGPANAIPPYQRVVTTVDGVVLEVYVQFFEVDADMVACSTRQALWIEVRGEQIVNDNRKLLVAYAAEHATQSVVVAMKGVCYGDGLLLLVGRNKPDDAMIVEAEASDGPRLPWRVVTK